MLFGCALVFSLIVFTKRGPSSLLAAIAKSGFTAAFTLIFVSEIGDKVTDLLVPKAYISVVLLTLIQLETIYENESLMISSLSSCSLSLSIAF